VLGVEQGKIEALGQLGEVLLLTRTSASNASTVIVMSDLRFHGCAWQRCDNAIWAGFCEDALAIPEFLAATASIAKKVFGLPTLRPVGSRFVCVRPILRLDQVFSVDMRFARRNHQMS